MAPTGASAATAVSCWITPRLYCCGRLAVFWAIVSWLLPHRKESSSTINSEWPRCWVTSAQRPSGETVIWPPKIPAGAAKRPTRDTLPLLKS
jgi:hypothetical protein